MLFGVMSAIMFGQVSTRFLFLLVKISDSYFTFYLIRIHSHFGGLTNGWEQHTTLEFN